jgi:TolB-like protein/Flp pilus assembly protein TadD
MRQASSRATLCVARFVAQCRSQRRLPANSPEDGPAFNGAWHLNAAGGEVKIAARLAVAQGPASTGRMVKKMRSPTRTPPERQSTPTAPDTEPKAARLDSWKEIAVFLKRGVRTIQRWERTEGLPVHRHQHDKMGSVYAYEPEIAAWWSSRQPSPGGGAPTALRSEHRQPAEKAARIYAVRLVVLPLKNLSGDPAEEYFSDGLTEEMITQLHRQRPGELGVIARTTAMHYKGSPRRVDQIARELGVDYIVEGSVRRAAERVRITAQLVRAKDQTHLWSETYDRDLRAILDLQREVAEQIARRIHIALSLRQRASAAPGVSSIGVSRPAHPAAYEAYLGARYLVHQLTPDSLAQGIALFRAAIAKDPEFARAYAGLAEACALLATVPFDALPPRETMPQAAAAAQRALELDDSLAEAHAALGLVRHHYEWNWRGAEESYRRAIELNPALGTAHLRYAWLLLALGRGEEAMQEIERAWNLAVEIDPQRLVVVRATRAAAYYFGRQFDRVIEECHAALELDAAYFPLHYLLGRAYARKGQPRKALAELEKAAPHTGEVLMLEVARGQTCGALGKRAAAMQAIKKLHAVAKRRYVPATYFGMLYSSVGKIDEAFVWLERAFDERADGLTLLGVEPMIDSLRGDPRMQDLLRRIGLSG